MEEDDAEDPVDPSTIVDISGNISPQLLQSLDSANWKDRKTSLDYIDGLLRPGMKVAGNLEVLCAALKPRLSDSNKLLSALALSICAKLAKALGPEVDRCGRVMVTPALKSFSDAKPQVRKLVGGIKCEGAGWNVDVIRGEGVVGRGMRFIGVQKRCIALGFQIG